MEASAGAAYNPANFIASGGRITCIGNASTNGVLQALNADAHATLVGNTFGHTHYRDTYYTAFGAIGWQDGAAFS